jgi:hypothetical protein
MEWLLEFKISIGVCSLGEQVFALKNATEISEGGQPG